MKRLLRTLLITSIAIMVSPITIAQGPGGGGGGPGGPGRGGPGGRGRGMDAANGAQAANNALAANAQAGNAMQRGNQAAGGRQQDANLQEMAKIMIASFDTNGDGALNATELQTALAGLRDMMQSQQMQGGGMQGGSVQGGPAAGMQAANLQNPAGLAVGDGGAGMLGGGRGRPQGPGGRR